MKKSLKLLFASLCVCLFIVSCNNSNNKVFGLQFGDNQQDVKATLLKQGFQEVSLVEYIPLNGKSISFGGHSWDRLNVFYDNNGLLDGIIFEKDYGDKDSALSDYKAIYADFSKQHNFFVGDEFSEFEKIAVATEKDRLISIICHEKDADKKKFEVKILYSPYFDEK